MSLPEFKVEIMEYMIYLLLPLIGYAVVKVVRNSIGSVISLLCKKTPLGKVTDKAQEKIQVLKAELKTIPDKAKFARKWFSHISVGSFMIFLAAICFVNAFQNQMSGEGLQGEQKMILWMIPFLVYGLCNRYRAYRFNVISLIFDILGIVVVYILLNLNCGQQGDPALLLSADTNQKIVLQNALLMCLSWLGCFLLLEIYYMLKGGIMTLYRFVKVVVSIKKNGAPEQENEKEGIEEAQCKQISFGKCLPRAYMGSGLGFGLVAAFVWILVFGVLIERTGLRFDSTLEEIALEYFTSPIHILNILILLSACAIPFFAFGKGTGGFLALFIAAAVYIANYIKLEYHNSFFTWFDLLQIKEMLLMGKEFLTPKIIGLIVGGIIALVAFIVVLRKPLGRLFHIRFYLMGTIGAVGVLVFFGDLIYTQQFKSMEIYPRTWENEDVNVEYNGLVVNLVHNLKVFGEIQMDAPQGYSSQTAQAMKEKFDAIDVPYSDYVQPDVILILAESLFDLDDVEGITLSQDIDATVDAYSAGTLISPRYGGYTSAMEFEALTGLSLAYMPNSLTPYTTYFNNPKEEFPCIVQEFKKNDYHTIAMHPGLPNFYNRTIVYKNFGFDEYLSVEYFAPTPEQTTDNGFYKDVDFGNAVIKKLQEIKEPTFIFGISMEGHYVTVDKYADPLVKATSTVLPADRLNQIEQQATSYYYTDQMIANIIDYMNNTDRPTLLYVYGDHLPPVEEFTMLGFNQEKYGKYSTSLVMYSNYKTISTGTEYITPNQLAAQIMVDSSIEYSSYYDYIYSIRDKYPILHKEFVKVEDNPELDDYYFLQYDILSGKKYLFEKNK